MNVDEQRLKMIKAHFDFNDQEMKEFMENKRNQDVLSRAPELMNTTIVAKVVESSGCNSQHKVGDELIFDGAGNLITKFGPKIICVYALSAISRLIFCANELFYAGTDPNEMRFKRTGCFDVGVKCGGWGHIVMELSVEKGKRKK